MASAGDTLQPSQSVRCGSVARLDSDRSAEAEAFSEKSTVEVPPALPQRTYTGSVRDQFASALQAHFASCSDPETGSPSRRPPNAPRFRGVTKHKRTQRYEAHIWECKKQIYLGGFDSETLAAKSHDIMALRCKGADCEILNYPLEEYAELLPLVERLSREDIINALRNYSKAQTAMRTGSMPSSPRSHSFQLSTVRSGGVHKVGSINRRSSLTSVPGRRPGQLRVSIPPRHRRADFLMSDDEDEMEIEADEGSPTSAYPRAVSMRVRASPRRSRPSRCPGAISSPRTSMTLAGVPSLSSLPSLQLPQYWTWNAPASPNTPHANPAAPPLSPEDVAEYDSVDLNMVLSHLADEPSLTYSATDESYLFASVPVDATHTALEHLCGAALFQPASSNPDSPVSRVEASTPFDLSTHVLGIPEGTLPGLPMPINTTEADELAAGGSHTDHGSVPVATNGWASGRVVGVEPPTPQVPHLQRSVGSLALVSPFAAASPLLKVTWA